MTWIRPTQAILGVYVGRSNLSFPEGIVRIEAQFDALGPRNERHIKHFNFQTE